MAKPDKYTKSARGKKCTVRIGQIFGRLEVVAQLSNKGVRRNWMCCCECGKNTQATTTALRTGVKKSCGCLVVESNKAQSTHGLTGTRIYKIWEGMISRCHNKSDKDYSRYGLRGIQVCEEWRNSITVFHDDMGDPPAGLSIDRIDNNKGYSKDNCRWADSSIQARNRRTSRDWFVYGLKFDTCTEAARHFGVSHQAIIQKCKSVKHPDCYSVTRY